MRGFVSFIARFLLLTVGTTQTLLAAVIFTIALDGDGSRRLSTIPLIALIALALGSVMLWACVTWED